MKAAFFRQHGGPEVLEVGELPDPLPAPGEVVVSVRAAALNHLDLWVRRGLPGLDVAMPHIGGSDIAGVIAEVGDGVEGWSPGDRVVANPGLWCERCEWCARGEHSLCERYGIIGEHVAGGFAEKARVPARNLLSLPAGHDFERAAAAPLVFQTAWRALMTRASLQSGETVLITGASGGVSTAAVQIAKLAGATVFAVTSGDEYVRRVRELGADLVIDRQKEDFADRVWGETGKRGVDIVLDSVGEAIFEACLRTLAPAGRLVTYGATTGDAGRLSIRRTFWRQIAVLGSTMASQSEYERVMSLIFEGRLSPIVDAVLPLDRAAEAYERLETGSVFGKILLAP
jgi:NADPH:quinone reductase-like Zn-dependent oxidoreductase